MKKILISALAAGIMFAGSSMAASGLSAQDYFEIQQLYARYNIAIDGGDAEGWAATFTPDGVFNTFVGHDALVNFVKTWREKLGGGTRKHWNTNLQLTGNAKEASGSVYLMLVDFSTKPPSIVATATYADSLIKTKDGWRFTKRTTKGDAAPAGFVTFSYELAPLMLTNDDLSLFSVILKDPRGDDGELIADDRGIVTSRPAGRQGPTPPVTRTVTFGGRDWTLGYYAKTNAAMRAQQTATIVAAIGLALTAIVCGLFGYVAYNNLRLSREIQVRIGFERRLTAVIDELNHRVKNILAVIQSIVTRTLRHGSDIDVARELLIGRIHAMSNVVSLLSESQWQGVKLKGLFEARAIPHAERIAVSGPDITVSARAAQSLSLLFFELASHSDEGLSLVGKHPHIVAHWEVNGEDPDIIFHFRWEEFNTSAATRREDSDFGVILLDRVAPEALGGTSKRYFTDVSYVYELTAPMDTVVDMSERDRTEQFSAPAKPGR